MRRNPRLRCSHIRKRRAGGCPGRTTLFRSGIGPLIRNIARGMIRQIIPLSSETVEAERNPWYLAAKVPVRRLELRFGKMGINDFFDVNSGGTDSHLQFMNWTVDNNGAYDYAADTRGYTWGAVVEYESRSWGLRFGEALMPRVANGIDMDWNIRHARAENVELDIRPVVF